MTRTITVQDDEDGVTTQLIIHRNRITEVRIATEFVDGLPDDILHALLPFIGLPGVRPRRQDNGNGSPRERINNRPPAAPIAVPTPAPTREEARAIPSRPPTPLASIDFVAAPSVVEPEPEAAVEPQAEASTPKPAPVKSGRGGSKPKYPPPTQAAMTEAMRRLGASPSKLANHFGVPHYIVKGWLVKWRSQEL